MPRSWHKGAPHDTEEAAKQKKENSQKNPVELWLDLLFKTANASVRTTFNFMSLFHIPMGKQDDAEKTRALKEKLEADAELAEAAIRVERAKAALVNRTGTAHGTMDGGLKSYDSSSESEPGAALRGPGGLQNASSPSQKKETPMSDPMSDQENVPSIERIEIALASLEARGVDIDQLELEDLRSRWSKHPLRDVLEPSGFDFED